ncbi:MAG: hypothetical protein V4773_07825 [Verrucomicrobiota bacterium]
MTAIESPAPVAAASERRSLDPLPSSAADTASAPRFTVDGSAQLEEHLARTCAKIGAGIRGLVPAAKLEAVLLGGGYGRGEGGVLRTPADDRPYNDLEFYICIRGNRHLNELRFGHALHVLGEILTPQAGIEVEFKITSLRELAAAPVSMFSYDLVMGHRWLVGDESLLDDCDHHRATEDIPLAEATRLLMNRCTGLLFAREKLEKREFTPADADFVRRNIAKAELALGDALLVTYLHYHWSARERLRQLPLLSRLEALPWMAQVRHRHATGVAFKLHPERSDASRETLLDRHRDLVELSRHVFFWIEEHRLGTGFASPADYALSTQNKCPEQSATRNVLIGTRALGLRPLLEARAGRHPRERILNAMALLLWDPAALSTPRLRARLHRDLQTRGTTFPEILAAYRNLWSRVN